MDPVADLARLLAPGEHPAGVRLRQGKIISVAADGTATITIGGDSTQVSGVAVASHVSVDPGNACWLVVNGRDAFVIATIGPRTWRSYTPTLENITLGDGSVLARYTRSGKTAHAAGRLLLGSQSSIASNPRISLPVTPAFGGLIVPNVRFVDAGTSFHFGLARITGSSLEFYAINTNSTYGAFSVISATTPFTWAVNDEIVFNVSYEVA